jgi:hypothetical protein
MGKIALAILLALIVGGCLNNQAVGRESIRPSTEYAATTTVASQQNGLNDTPGAATIYDALNSGGSFLCNYTDGIRRCEVWVKGGNYYSRISSSRGLDTEVVGDGEWTYIWYTNQKIPVKYKTTEILKMTGEVTPEQIKSGHAATVYYDILEIAKNTKRIDCPPAEIPDSVLTPPANLRFQTVRGEIKDLKVG